MVGQAIKWMLIGYGSDGYNPQYDIYNIVGNNVYPNVVPQNVGLPAIVYRVDKTDPDKVKEVRALDNRVYVEIDVKDKSYSVVNQLSTLIINQLHRYNNTFNSNDSDSIGYGTNEGSNQYGKFAPASTGTTQYVGGIQITYLRFENLVETYDKKLDVYNNTLTFELVYIDDLSVLGADVYVKLTDLNLMSTNINSTDDPLYTQPISLNQGVNYLFTPSVLSSDNADITDNTLDGIYENWYDPSGTSNTNRPTLKQSADNPPIYNENNYLEFSTNNFLLSSKASDRINRKYKRMTMFGVFEMPNSETGADGTKNISSFLFKKSTTTDNVCGIYTKVNVVSNAAGLIQYEVIGTALEDDGSGGTQIRGFNISLVTKWAMFGINTTYSWEKPTYVSVSYDKTAHNVVGGEFELILSNDFTMYGDKDNFGSWSDTASTSFANGLFNFETLGSDVTNYDTRGAGIIDANYSINIYDFACFSEKMTFGSNRYNQVKRQIIEKHNMLKRITN